MNLPKYIEINYARMSDLMDIYNLANETTTRQNSINQSQIKLDEHIKWFESKISNPNYVFYVVKTNENEFVGYVRFDKNIPNTSCKHSFTISLSLVKKFRGRGLSSTLIHHCTNLLFDMFIPCKVVAIIKKENIVSQRAFSKAGYELVGMEPIKNIYCYTFEVNSST